MRTGDEYQEYSEPQFAKPSRKTHKWTLIDREHKVEKYRCKHCRCVKTIVTVSSRYPIIRYNGVEGKAPGCLQSAKDCEAK